MSKDEEMDRICGHVHPLIKVVCMKSPGHDGAHWCMHRWLDDGTYPPPKDYDALPVEERA